MPTTDERWAEIKTIVKAEAPKFRGTYMELNDDYVFVSFTPGDVSREKQFEFANALANKGIVTKARFEVGVDRDMQV